MKQREMYLVRRDRYYDDDSTSVNVGIYETKAAASAFIKEHIKYLYELYGQLDRGKRSITAKSDSTYYLSVFTDKHFLKIRVYYEPIDVFLEDWEGTMIIYELNDAKNAESIYFETKEAAIRAGAGICYERDKGSFKFFFNTLYNYTRYEDITIEPIIVY